ncbi:hypothetical protein E5676_scaffold333G001170 [Cucumis melo var. makuwa]|uniref:CCHC-type domain-containing protein n=1 Tax=Cucumis melo var. makuwa TaxID=1194695 RepID=A0A5D3DF58_CUCMM|nr:hypothetical protein E6C27_scaffold55G001680 [Cucumis melo var. makuwa]TYK22226.1 hypothetical protein E5676_scaffold333G001170 [Cucumis melo var. makuwa]
MTEILSLRLEDTVCTESLDDVLSLGKQKSGREGFNYVRNQVSSKGKAPVFIQATDQQYLDDVAQSSNCRTEKKSGGLTHKKICYFCGKPGHIRP